MLEAIAANPDGERRLISDDLSGHTSPSLRAWLAATPRVQHLFIPTGAWRRIVRRAAFAGQTFAGDAQLERSTDGATKQLNARAQP